MLVDVRHIHALVLHHAQQRIEPQCLVVVHVIQVDHIGDEQVDQHRVAHTREPVYYTQLSDSRIRDVGVRDDDDGVE
eukprot:40215-Eustigmatos_ZCMA.PRE.1